jgi:hypothetical protein
LKKGNNNDSGGGGSDRNSGGDDNRNGNGNEDGDKGDNANSTRHQKADATQRHDVHGSCDRHSCRHSSKCRVLFAFFVFLLVIICAAGEYFFSKYDNSRLEFSENNRNEMIRTLEESIEKNKNAHVPHLTKLQNDVAKLQDDIATLKGEVSKYTKEMGNKTKPNENQLRKKWKIWVALKSKMEDDSPFGAELEEFNNAFAGDQELIEMVKDLANGVDLFCNANKKDGKNESCCIISSCKKYLGKIIRIKKIDHRKLLEVSGYVLSHVNKE